MNQSAVCRVDRTGVVSAMVVLGKDQEKLIQLCVQNAVRIPLYRSCHVATGLFIAATVLAKGAQPDDPVVGK